MSEKATTNMPVVNSTDKIEWLLMSPLLKYMSYYMKLDMSSYPCYNRGRKVKLSTLLNNVVVGTGLI